MTGKKKASQSVSGPPQSDVQPPDALMQIQHTWLQLWPEALACWSPFTRLLEPTFFYSHKEATGAGLTGSFACILLDTHRILINLKEISEQQLEAYGLEILAHEIGHHVYTPADLNDNGKLLSRIRRGLPNVEEHAPTISNLYTDLLINDRLHREAGLDMSAVFLQLERKQPKSKSGKTAAPRSQLWLIYLRIYELLWAMRQGTLVPDTIPSHMEADAWLGSRLIRAYHRDWLDGSGRFAALMLPYLLEDQNAQARSPIASLLDAIRASGKRVPDGLVEIDPSEAQGDLHPIHDPRLNDLLEGANQSVPEDTKLNPDAAGGQKRSDGKHGNLDQADPETHHRDPLTYADLLRSLGIILTPLDTAVRYYRERARRHRIPFPTRPVPSGEEEHPEGLGGWEPGDPLEQLDYLNTLIQSPVLIPGITTVTRLTGKAPSQQTQQEPPDLDIYVDCSGSMPNPSILLSYTTLAGTIIAQSALRAGSRIKATLWSDESQSIVTEGFVRDETQILRVMCGYIGNGTAFPINLLHNTIAQRKRTERKLQVLIISDDGISTLFDGKMGNLSGEDVAMNALKVGGGGGTLLLQLAQPWQAYPFLVKAARQGWQIWSVTSLDELVTLAREFTRRHYQTLNTQHTISTQKFSASSQSANQRQTPSSGSRFATGEASTQSPQAPTPSRSSR